ncbi:META domain-containing protein [Elizabethkingia argentiflava]|uniref:META domain-containing protein n=1 Tax=Elizabethkingia argenteiflava TaxID=2681556 RepID=A0A845PQK6_9FLAO|nr:META domain-containing protein [Elizabethkingia argenteiflava]NAW50472.1 META domain-containing protein [Elizabethkingia argenteiflava]
MKRVVLLTVLLFSLMSIVRCVVAQDLNYKLQRKWMLVSLKEFSKAELIHAKACIDLTSQAKAASAYVAFMGCNNLSFQLKEGKGNKISISHIGGTRKFCSDHLDLENQFISVFSRMHSYAINGHFLTLTNKEGEKMVFVAADWD